jgi:integrase
MAKAAMTKRGSDGAKPPHKRRRGNEEGLLTQHKDGRWMAALTIGKDENGKTKRVWYTGKTREEAKAKLDEGKRKIYLGILSADPGQTLHEYLVGWLQNVRSSIRPRTWDSYDLCVRRMVPYLGAIRLRELKPADVKQCYTNLERGTQTGRPLSKRTVHQCHAVLHEALEHAMDWELLERNVSDRVKAPRPDRVEMKTLTVEQLDRLFAVTIEDRWHALWVLLGTRGLRIGEAMGLKWSDVDFDSRNVVIRRALQRQRNGAGLQFVPPKSSTSRRTVSLGQTACAALREHRRHQNVQRLAAGHEWVDNDLIFCTITGTPMDPSRINYYLNQALKKAALPRVRIHDLRHSAATMLAQQGENARLVQEMLGHSTVSLTLGTYTHVSPAMHREAADRMDAQFTYRKKDTESA